LQELAKMIGGLLRQSQRREAPEEGSAATEGEARERVRFYH
jgi:hypothetical protein